ncbi:hypothetical protein Pelo_9696 [Pelomyxa schiedti]|nr:hypothetical protein Pelo_9696 [Pelomyxa schiedti]
MASHKADEDGVDDDGDGDGDGDGERGDVDYEDAEAEEREDEDEEYDGHEEEEYDDDEDEEEEEEEEEEDPVWQQIVLLCKGKQTRESMNRDMALYKSKLDDLTSLASKEPTADRVAKLAALNASLREVMRNIEIAPPQPTEQPAARRFDDLSEYLPKLQLQVESTVLSMLDAPPADAEEPTTNGDIYDIAFTFWKYLRAIGRSPEEIFAVWHHKQEIVGVGVTEKMSKEDRHHYDLVVGACVTRIAEMFISEFDEVNNLVAAGAGPFLGRLFEIAHREYPKSSDEWDLPAFGAATNALKRLMWVPNCRHLFVPFASQLQVLLNNIPHRIDQELLICCVNLGPVLPQVVNELCDTFVSKLAQGRSLNYKPPFRWVNGWDVLPRQASKDVVEFLKHCNVTARIIAGFLQFCESFGSQEVFSEKIPWLMRKVISKVTKLCSVDPENGHKAILQFVEDHIGSDKMLLKAVSALLIIPVIVTGGAVNENLVMKAITLAIADDSPSHLDILLSTKQLYAHVSSSSIALLLEKAMKTHTTRGEGLLYHMLKFCADRIKRLPIFSFAAARYIAQYKQERQRSSRAVKQSQEDQHPIHVLDIWSTCIHSVYRHASHFEMRVASLSVDVSSCFATAFTVLLASEHPGERTRTLSSGAFTCLSSVMQLCCQSSLSMIEDNESSVVSLWSRSPDRRACMEEVFEKWRQKPLMWGPLLKAMLISEIQPIAPPEPRKLPRLLHGIQQTNVVVEEKIQEVLKCPVVTKCYEAALNWLQHPIGSDIDESKICRLITMWPGHFKTPFLFWAVGSGAYDTVCKLLPLCEPEHVPCSCLLSAVAHGFRDIADLLWCHGVFIPESKLSEGKVSIRAELFDAHHPSVRRFVNHAATWDPLKHQLFPWWFKVHILRTVLLCWLRNTSYSSATVPADAGHPIGALDGECNTPVSIGRLSWGTIHHILSFLSPVHWF